MTIPITGIPSVSTFRAWLETSHPGDSVIYHSGYLAKDRQRIPGQELPACSHLGALAWDWYEAREVCLTQRKLADGAFEYIATKRFPVVRRRKA